MDRKIADSKFENCWFHKCIFSFFTKMIFCLKMAGSGWWPSWCRCTISITTAFWKFRGVRQSTSQEKNGSINCWFPIRKLLISGMHFYLSTKRIFAWKCQVRAVENSGAAAPPPEPPTFCKEVTDSRKIMGVRQSGSPENIWDSHESNNRWFQIWFLVGT